MAKYKGTIESLDMGDGVSIVSLAPDSMTMPKGRTCTINIKDSAWRVGKKGARGMAVVVEIVDDKVVGVELG